MFLSHHRRTPLRTERGRREGGYVLAMFGLLLVPLLLMAGLAVDVGSWYSRASDIQKATDAASLAGVVWLPDIATARSVALDVAKRNGFDNADSNITVTVNPSTKSPRRLQVTIVDNRVGSFFWGNLGGRAITLERNSYAEYVTPVPMGSPRNYFGTGKLLSGTDQELIYQSVNAYCTDKIQGDRKQSRYFNGGHCGGGLNDPDYTANGYEMYIDAVKNRTSDINVMLYDARYNTGNYSTTLPGPQTCSTTYTSTYTYPTNNDGWSGPDWSGNTSDITINGPRQYQTASWSGWDVVWSSTATIDETQSFTYPRYALRYRSPTKTVKTPTKTCVDTTQPYNEAGIDMALGSSDSETFTYSLFAADNTPLNDADNPLICKNSFKSNTPFDDGSFLGSRRWNTMTVADGNPTTCRIAPGDTSGRYILRVQNQGSPTTADGANQYGVVARYANAAGDGLCDGRTDVMCPRVYGKEFISVYANTSSKTASFYLAEIGPEHVGKKLKLELWDPGEGGDNIQIMKPTGTNTWTPMTFTWKVDNGATTSTDTLDVKNSAFNGKLVEITVDLTGYNPPANNRWWQIKYAFTSGSVTDRTTWSARIVGDPVHLLEEN